MFRNRREADLVLYFRLFFHVQHKQPEASNNSSHFLGDDSCYIMTPLSVRRSEIENERDGIAHQQKPKFDSFHCI